MSAPEHPQAPEVPAVPDVPDVAVLARVLDGLRALPEQSRRRADGGGADAGSAAVPLPRRR